MNRRAIRIGKQMRVTGKFFEPEDGICDAIEPRFAGITVFSGITSNLSNDGIRIRWDLDGDSAQLEPHEARALGEALIAAADDVAAYRLKP